MPGLAFALLVWTRHEVLNNYFKITIRVARHIIPRSTENQTSLLQGLPVTCWTLRPCPHVSVLVWKRKIFFANCLPVHSYSANTAAENGTFRKRSPRWEIFETVVFLHSCGRMKMERLHHGMVSHARFKMADGSTTLEEVSLGFFSSLKACLEISLTLLNIQADYVRRGLRLSGDFHSRSRRSVWNVLTEDKDKQELKDFGLDQDVQVLGGITLLPKLALIVFKSCLRIPVDGRKRFHNAILWTEIFLKTDKKKIKKKIAFSSENGYERTGL